MPLVLIVDDNPADVDLLQDAFSELAIGATFVIAENGDEGIRTLQQIAGSYAPRPAVILLDLNMPRINGREVLTFVKSTPALKAIPTIILTSSSSPRDRADCLALGADAFYTKPGTLDELSRLASDIRDLTLRGPSRSEFRGEPPADGTGLVAGLRDAVAAVLGRVAPARLAGA